MFVDQKVGFPINVYVYIQVMRSTGLNLGQNISTPGYLNSLFGYLFRDFWRGILGCVRDYLGEVWGGFYWKNKRIWHEKTRKTIEEKSRKQN